MDRPCLTEMDKAGLLHVVHGNNELLDSRVAWEFP